jgi:branched-subunit amino acid aminotransferase/4-amino-4-deoxychorismate lyase
VSGFRVWTLVDGVFREGAVLSPLDRGFRYGMSVFETMAVCGGKILFLEEHLAALQAACVEAGFQADTFRAASALQGLPDGLLRIYITAGEGSLKDSTFRCQTFALFEPASFPSFEEVARGARVGISQERTIPVLRGWKTGNYWPHVRALVSARGRGLDEVLMLDSHGMVISASMANVFFAFGAELRTPAVDLGARRGVVREWIKEMVPVDESFLSAEEIREADECFLTNSRIGVLPVAEIEGRCLPSRSRGLALAGLYREKILNE